MPPSDDDVGWFAAVAVAPVPPPRTAVFWWFVEEVDILRVCCGAERGVCGGKVGWMERRSEEAGGGGLYTVVGAARHCPQKTTSVLATIGDAVIA